MQLHVAFEWWCTCTCGLFKHGVTLHEFRPCDTRYFQEQYFGYAGIGVNQGV